MNARPASPAQRAAVYDQLPCGIVLIDRSLRIADHNRTFGTLFGDGVGMRCYEKYKGRSTACADCPALQTFRDGKTRVLEDTGTDCFGQSIHYMVQMTPLRTENGETSHVAAITTDLTATKRLQHEYQILFEQVPCYVAVINRQYRVVKANELFRRTFGEPRGEHCYDLFKHRHSICPDCPAARTFEDGGSHSAHHVGVAQDGQATHYVVSTAPLVRGERDGVAHVIEMCLDVTQARQLQHELEVANTLRETLFEETLDAIIVLDERQRVVLMNRAAESLWSIARARSTGRRVPRRLVPPAIGPVLSGQESSIHLLETTVVNLAGESIPVRLAAVALCDERATSETAAGRLGTAVIAQDLRTIKQLEHDKLEAERLAAVGQTVAGLAHGIKNILTGLEGGMYVTSTGLARADHGRIERGFGMLERNMGRIGSLARDLLAFSRGDRPHPDLVDPAAILREVVELFAENAGQHGIRIVSEITGRFAPASLDAEGIHSCLANLVSNAIDACLVSDRVPAAIAETEAPDQLPTNGSDRESAASGHRRCTITARLVEVDETLVYEIADTGCGMDYEIKQKVFTSFFTTKSTGGTGLGLLTTRKIVQQHGGTIDFESTPGEGTTFRIRFQRRRLPVPEDNEPPAEGGRSHGENHATAR